MPIDDPLTWARGRAAKLWTFSPGTSERSATIGDLTIAVRFLSEYAGQSSIFTRQAALLLDPPDKAYLRAGAMAELLAGWVEAVEGGFAIEAPFELRARVEASTDLMEQVALLLDDPETHPAASVMLAGAALEEMLRGLVEQSSTPVVGKPGINSYAEALRKADLISRQEKKEIDWWAGKRNDAAHGNFEAVSDRNSARLMVDGINLFMQQKSQVS
jgi:hypothetical protein